MATCVFCNIIAGTAPASMVYQDEVCSAFMSLHQVNPGHVLVVPNAHAASLADLDPDAGAHVFRVAQRVAAAVRRSGVHCEGINLSLADGAAAGQDVFHVHLHVIPRFVGDGFGLRRFGRLTARADLDRLATQIQASL